MRGQQAKAATLSFAVVLIVLQAVGTTPAYAAGPNPVLVQLQIEPRPVPPGQSFYVTVIARNDGDLAWDGYITLAFPDNPSLRIVEQDGTCPADTAFLGPAYIIHPGGDLLHYRTREAITAVYPIAEACYRDWQPGATHYLRVEVTPRDHSRPTLVYVRISMRGYVGDRRAEEIVTYPTASSQLDQQGFPVLVEVVEVLMPPTSLPPTPTLVIQTPRPVMIQESPTPVPPTPTPTSPPPSPTVLVPRSPAVMIPTTIPTPLPTTKPLNKAWWGWAILGLILFVAFVLGAAAIKFGPAYPSGARKEGIMFCPKCGAENKDTARFCKSCGQPLARAPRKPAWLTGVLVLVMVCAVAAITIYLRFWLRPAGTVSIAEPTPAQEGIAVVSHSSWQEEEPQIPEVEWDRTFGGSDYDWGCSVQQTSDGGYILVGETRSYGAGRSDVWLIKTDADGNKLWERTFGGSDWDESYSVQQTSDGGYILVGLTGSYGAGGGDVWLIKTDADGNKLWDRTFGGSNHDLGYSVQQTSDGGYILVGETCSYGAGKSDVWLIRTDADGNKLWDRTFGGSDDDEGSSVQQTSDGGYILVGETCSSGAGKSDVWLIRTDADGNKLWERTFGGSDWDESYSVQQTSDGGYIIVGGVGSTEAHAVLEGDVWLIRTDADGNKLWERTFGGSDDDWGSSVQQTSDGGYILVGLTGSYGAGGGDVWLIKVRGINNPPARPSNVSPSDGARDVSLTPNLESSPFSDPDSGDIHSASQWQVTKKSGDYTSPIFDSGVDATNLTQIAIPPGVLDFNTTYYWRVRYQDNHGNWSEWSKETSFIPSVSLETRNRWYDSIKGEENFLAYLFHSLKSSKGIYLVDSYVKVETPKDIRKVEIRCVKKELKLGEVEREEATFELSRQKEGVFAGEVKGFKVGLPGKKEIIAKVLIKILKRVGGEIAKRAEAIPIPTTLGPQAYPARHSLLPWLRGPGS